MSATREQLSLVDLPSEILQYLANMLDTQSLWQFVQTNRLIYRTTRSELISRFFHERATKNSILMPAELNNFYLSRAGLVFACGVNNQGILGVGNTDVVVQPQQIRKEFKVESIVAKNKRAFLLLTNGQVAVTGNNKNGELGLGDKNSRDTFDIIPNVFDVKKIVSHSNYTIFLTNTGLVYSCGSNCSGALGVVDPIPVPDCYLLPVMLNLPTRIKDVEAENCNTLMLAEDGKVYGFGKNAHGQLGLGHQEAQETPVLITVLGKEVIKKIYLKDQSSYFLTQEGSVLSCGKNDSGQLGLGDVESRALPEKIRNLYDVIKIASVDERTFFLLQNGEVFVCGSGSDGQLGLGEELAVTFPRKISGIPPVVDIVVTAEASLFITKSGDVFVSGLNTKNMLGLGACEKCLRPQQVHGVSNVQSVFLRYHSSVFIKTNGQIYVAGENSHGQLGLGHKEIPDHAVLHPRLNGIMSVDNDAQSVVFNRKDGAVFAAGYNQSGEIGWEKAGVSYKKPKMIMFPSVKKAIKALSFDDYLVLGMRNGAFTEYFKEKIFKCLAKIESFEDRLEKVLAIFNRSIRYLPGLEKYLPEYQVVFGYATHYLRGDQAMNFLKIYTALLLCQQQVKRTNEEEFSLKGMYEEMLSQFNDPMLRGKLEKTLGVPVDDNVKICLQMLLGRFEAQEGGYKRKGDELKEEGQPEPKRARALSQ